MRQSNVRRLVYAGFIGALIILTVIISLSYKSLNGFLEIDSKIEHTHYVEEDIDTLSLLLADIQNKTRAILLTGDSSYAATRTGSIVALHTTIQALKDSVSDNPSQLENLRMFDTIAAKLLAISDQGFTLPNDSNRTAQIAYRITLNHKNLDSARVILAKMTATENKLLNERKTLSNRNSATAKIALEFGTGTSFILLIIIFVFLRRDIEERRKAQRTLSELNEDLEDRIQQRTAELQNANTQLQEEIDKHLRSEAILAEAQRITRLGSWEMVLNDLNDLRKNPLEWSVEVFRIFGHKPGKIEPTTENFYHIIHPDDRDKVDMAVRNYLNDGERLFIDHRIIRADGTERIVHEEGNILFDVRTRKPLRIVGTIQDITERKLEEERLKRIQQNLEDAQRIGHMGSWELDLSDLGSINKNRVFASDEVLRIFGFPTGEENIRLRFEQGVHPDDRNKRDKALYDYLAGGPPYNVDYRVVRPDGTIRVVHSEGRLFYDGKTGKPLRLVGTMQDITARKLEEQQLRRSQSDLAEAQRIAHLGSWAMDLSTQTKFDESSRIENSVTWSDEVYRIFGFEPGDIEAARDRFSQFIHPDDKEMVEKNIRDYLNGGPGHSIDYRIIRPDGTERVVHEEANIVRDETTGHPLWIVGTIQDITVRVKMEARLQEYYEQMKGIMENIDIVLMSLDMDNMRVLEISPACEKIYGCPVDAFINDPMLWKKMVHPDDIPVIIAGEARILSGNTSTDEYRIIRPDSTVRWIEERMKPTLNKEGKLIRLEGFIADITERKMAEDRIRGSLQEKEVLLKEVHHRVKNNMQVISSLLNLQGEYIRDSHDRELFRDSQSRVKSMALVHEMLYQSKNLAQVNFKDYIRNIVDQLFSFYSVNMGKIELEIEVGDILLGIDTAIPCGLIINELVSNALKYAFPDNRKGKISIYFSKEIGSYYTCIVRDSGVGLPSDIDFENTVSLGLQLVNTLTRQLGGKIELSREHGTEYRITFDGVE
jgi:PAS domain S-box-containing protein